KDPVCLSLLLEILFLYARREGVSDEAATDGMVGGHCCNALARRGARASRNRVFLRHFEGDHARRRGLGRRVGQSAQAAVSASEKRRRGNRDLDALGLLELQWAGCGRVEGTPSAGDSHRRAGFSVAQQGTAFGGAREPVPEWAVRGRSRRDPLRKRRHREIRGWALVLAGTRNL